MEIVRVTDEIQIEYPDIDLPVVIVIVLSIGIEIRYTTKTGGVRRMYQADVREVTVITDALLTINPSNRFMYNINFILMWQETLSSALHSKTGQRGMPLHLNICLV